MQVSERAKALHHSIPELPLPFTQANAKAFYISFATIGATNHLK